MTPKLPENLEVVIATVREQWRLQIQEPYRPGGSGSWVAPVHVRHGSAVLKVAWPHPEAEHEADGLAMWDGGGAVRLLDATVVDATHALLLERCDPGDALSTRLSDDQCDEVIANLLQRLWRTPPADSPFRPLADMCALWVAEAIERVDAVQPESASIVREGLAMFLELPGTADHEAVLVTDLHAGNVLAAEREPWLAIDPKPYVGDPTYDALQHMLNGPRLHTEPVKLVGRMASLLDLDAGRLQSWLFARCAVEAVVKPEFVDVMRLLS